jgi:DNA-binding NarL/FixJ family response regulator
MARNVETELLRIIQEALTNVRKHAGVDAARLIFILHAEEIQVVISDEGQGFTPSRIEHPDDTLHFGLTIMRERAEKMGGQLEVYTELGGGTQIIVRLPRTLAPRDGETLQGLRVLLVDDHDLYLKGLRNLLSARGIHVVGLAHDGVEAQRLARRHRPDLILMDIEMPRCDGIEATHRIKAVLPETRIVMLTVAADDETLFKALKSGADGYLLKDLESRQFFDLLRDVLQGDNVLSPGLAARTLKTLAADEGSETDDPTPTLTPRQREVLELVAQGMTNREIAQALHISPDTVKYHVSNVLERLHVQSRYELAGYTLDPSDH